MPAVFVEGLADQPARAADDGFGDSVRAGQDDDNAASRKAIRRP